MTDDDGTLDAESCKRLSEQISLSGRRPHGAARPVAVPETRAVKRNNVTLSLNREVEQAAQIAILGGGDIAMEKDDRLPAAPLAVVKPDTVDGNKPPASGTRPLYLY